MRVGQGYDVHRFGDGEFITIGGVQIAHDKGLIAHSDGDVLLHALCDALLGAAALGDIGQHFPDHDERYKNINSRELLRHVAGLLKEKGFQANNIDATVIAQSPKMAPHIQEMRENIAHDLNLDLTRVNIKATTTERLGFTGREEGIAAHTVVLIKET
ncbi:MAG: 2-C-methyl-D-erythritol 2,4-cyclodiphosphate synthase [Gammaproteobacteria bacterium]|nr:MAG: 2-C-methyl-D-erythritol 2,4-cyclodiphosphate synthase [Gammaproteobacteria bacterium]